MGGISEWCSLTINARALEDLAGLAAGTETVAFDLEKKAMSNSGWIETGLGSWEWWYLSFATGLAVHGLARFNRRAARRQAVDADLRARHRSLSTGERHRGRRKRFGGRTREREREREREGGVGGGGGKAENGQEYG